MAQSNSGDERVYVTLKLSGHTPSLREVRAGTQGRNREQELKQNQDTVHQLAPDGFLSLLFSYNPGPPGQVWYYAKWAGPSQVND